MNIVPMTIESLVAVLLLLTILYCVRLNGQLKRLKADKDAMKATIAELLTATETAERAIAGLKTTVREADQTLGERLRSAEQVSADIAKMTETGREVLERAVQATSNTNQPQAASAPPKPAAPDPKSIAKAAQAFTERAQARLKGAA